jgi:hypothetical protein
MKSSLRDRAGLIIGAVLVLLVSRSLSATAAVLITGKQIKDGSVAGRDIKNGSLTLVDLSAGTKTALSKGDLGSACTVPGTDPGTGPGVIEMEVISNGVIVFRCHAASADLDSDGDGVTVADGDCDDTDPTVAPVFFEVFDGKDTNCDGELHWEQFYTGSPPETENVGICHAGFKAENEVGPDYFTIEQAEQTPEVEILENGLDDDCDGQTDEIDP